MAQSQHPPMKVEMMKGIKNWAAFLNAHFEKKMRLAITRIWLSQNRGKDCKFTVKTKVSG